jgi:hypothetical protein
LLVVEVLENNDDKSVIKTKSVENLRQGLEEFVKRKPPPVDSTDDPAVLKVEDLDDSTDNDPDNGPKETVNNSCIPDVKLPQPSHVHEPLHSPTNAEAKSSVTSCVSNSPNSSPPTEKITLKVDTSTETNLMVPISMRRRSTIGDEFTERMRTAAVMLSQLQLGEQKGTFIPKPNKSTTRQIQNDTEAIREKIIKEMMTLEEQRLARLQALAAQRVTEEESGPEEMLREGDDKIIKSDKEDPSGMS